MQPIEFDLNDFNNDDFRTSYYENGFTLVNDVISNQELGSLRSELAKINRGDYSSAPLEPYKGEADEETLLGHYMYIGEPHSYSEMLRAYVTHAISVSS